MKIQIAQPSDCFELTTVEITSKKTSIPDLIDPIEIDLDLRFQRWKNYFNRLSPSSSKPERIVLKAIIDHKIIGYLAGHLSTRYGKDAEIQSFYILKNHQRKGIGLALLTNFSKWLKTQNAQSVCVGIEPENPYRAFYLKYGGQLLNPHWIYWDDLALGLLQKNTNIASG